MQPEWVTFAIDGKVTVGPDAHVGANLHRR